MTLRSAPQDLPKNFPKMFGGFLVCCRTNIAAYSPGIGDLRACLPFVPEMLWVSFVKDSASLQTLAFILKLFISA